MKTAAFDDMAWSNWLGYHDSRKLDGFIPVMTIFSLGKNQLLD